MTGGGGLRNALHCGTRMFPHSAEQGGGDFITPRASESRHRSGLAPGWKSATGGSGQRCSLGTGSVSLEEIGQLPASSPASQATAETARPGEARSYHLGLSRKRC